MEIVKSIALLLGVGWASGINLYAAISTLGLLEATGNIHLPPQLAVLGSPAIIVAAIAMYLIEFFADKVPLVDSTWDAIHTFIRIPAGAILAAKAIGPVSHEVEVLAGILGGTLAATTHVTKAGARMLINTSPEPFSNWMASILEDVMVIGGLWTALHHPLVFGFLFLIFVGILYLLLPLIFKGISLLVRRVKSFWVKGQELPS